MKTIKQIADELGVSKTSVRNQIANLGLRSSLRLNGNQFAIDEQQESLIKQGFECTTPQTKFAEVSGNQFAMVCGEVSDLITMLKRDNEVLHKELEIKNEQIAALNTALLASQQSIQAEQLLHGGTMKKQITDGDGNSTVPAAVPEGFFARIAWAIKNPKHDQL